MPMKVLGVVVVLLGLALMVFAGMAWRELHIAGTKPVIPRADSIPLTMLIYPQFLDTVGNNGSQPTKPAELAAAVLRRIYLIGGGSLTLIAIGILMLVAPQVSRTKQGTCAE